MIEVREYEYFIKKERERRTMRDHFWDKWLTWYPGRKSRFNDSNLYDEFHNLMHDVNFKGIIKVSCMTA